MTSRPRFVLGVLVLAIAPALSAQPSPTAAPAATPYAPKQADRPTPVEGDEPGFLPIFEGDRAILLGDAFVEGEQHQGWIEVMLTSRFPDRNVTFRNLGWSGDTAVGDSRFGLSLLQAAREPSRRKAEAEAPRRATKQRQLQLQLQLQLQAQAQARHRRHHRQVPQPLPCRRQQPRRSRGKR